MSPSYHRAAYFGHLGFPTDPVAAVGLLQGKSNFQAWHAAIQPILLATSSSYELIIGAWTEPRCPTPCTVEQQAKFDEHRRRWHTANTGTCRFIRATLAENVIPFVRQYNTAKTLFFNLVWLYGEDSGIDTQGGPPVPVNAHTMSAKRGRGSLLAVLEAKRTLDYLPLVGVTLTLPSPTTPTSDCTVSSPASGTDDHLNSLPSGIREDSTPEHALTLIRSFERAGISDSHTHSNSRPSPHSEPNPNLETIHEQDHEHGHEEPHPGRRIRISSGHATGSSLTACNRDVDMHTHTHVLSERSISPLTLSDSTSGYDEDAYQNHYHNHHHCYDSHLRLHHHHASHNHNQSHLHLEDISTSSTSRKDTTSHTAQASRHMKRQASAELGAGAGDGDEAEDEGEADGEERPPKASITSIFKAVKVKPGNGKVRKRDKLFASSFPLRRLGANTVKA
ncbi:hypothetical protein A1O7_00371 [Cladophialophora yegresii CBS 114405]|uniref:Uncharacterized protein n=1 Tax=Cladophialophora yegresii CBS 114405 TaxID=1182544 RepID=W9WHE6_9EURO|nr:uncharacterized protein A1O7_00371 [Cladophialophora yegresii CBS 114405]EXJ64036.1 hypothetical protein A1O7_00371 [Cladophialophora yegresii CBS 114405]